MPEEREPTVKTVRLSIIQRLAAGETVPDFDVDRDIVRFGSYYRIERRGRQASD